MKALFSPAIFFSSALKTAPRLGLLTGLAVLSLVALAYLLTHQYNVQIELLAHTHFSAAQQQQKVAELEARKAEVIQFTALIAVAISYLFGGLYFHWCQGLSSLRTQCQAISAGDFNYTPTHLKGENELALLQSDITTIATEFQRTIVATAESAAEVHNAARELNTLAMHEQENSGQQTMAVASMASATHQTAANISQIVEMSKWMQGVAEQSHKQAMEGSEVVTEAIEAIHQVSPTVNRASAHVNKLGDSSDRINNIIDLIQQIAEQTNLLALNAAIEAARAGEHGRGFAVVSDEVRHLAIRTHEATDQIRDIITDIQTNVHDIVSSTQEANALVETSVALANAASEDLSNIQREVMSTLEATKNIHMVVNEQSAASKEIAANIEHINSMVADNNADIEEGAATAIYLEQLSERMLTSLPSTDTKQG